MKNLENRQELNNFFSEIIGPSFSNFLNKTNDNTLLSIFGVQNSLKPAICLSVGNKIIYLAINDVFANSAIANFESMGLNVIKFPLILDGFLYKSAQSNELKIKRILALCKILEGNYDVVVAEISALYQFLPDPKMVLKNAISLKKNAKFDISLLEKRLIDAGYQREELIFKEGQFSRRGEIVDIFPINQKYAYRVDFFDDEIETIKIFDMQTQKPTKEVQILSIYPSIDCFFDENDIFTIENALIKLKTQNEGEVFNNQIDELLFRLKHGDKTGSFDCVMPYIASHKFSLFDYLKHTKEKFSIIIEEGKGCYDSLSAFEKDSNDRVKDLLSAKSLIAGKNKIYLSKQEILEKIKENKCFSFLKITNQNRFYDSTAIFSFKSLPQTKYLTNKTLLAKDIKNLIAMEYKVFIFAGSNDQAESIRNILANYDLNFKIASIRDKVLNNQNNILINAYENGFILPDEKIAIFGTYDLFAKKNTNAKLLSGEKSYFIPKIGDFVVHHIHGIGKCEGITTMQTPDGTKDYVVVSYRDGDRLYVPTTQMDLLDKFSGTKEPAKLSKIGGQEFAKVKQNVKDSIKKMAFSLIDLYAEREKIKGFSFSEDNNLMTEFENAFAYTETEDQLVAISDIKKDMQSGKVMDRLICGDVGFGKTEVAMRACFKAVIDGKQVAFVAPTTILSEQHFNTLKSRMNEFGVNIEVINRFKTKKQVEQILENLKLGKIDILCGTHRIFSEDVEFNDLGLIILDEEQKFGVEHKEKLKNKYKNVDVLTLSATPIPRTLNMALTKIRDISIIATPPSERLQVQTYVLEYSESMVKDAISRELARDGQVFILFNSVEKIYSYASEIQKLVPEAKVFVAHGQMNANEMENVIYDFYHRKGDVLICTTIIENGIDIENANTLIVCDADKLGLSQLYQLRGRVGRGNKLAFAYLTYQKEKILSEEAYKRLDAMSEFCEFGSGFKLALRDLEIRGGGNMLGPEQSGHLQKVGYEMYAKLLNEAIRELKGNKSVESEDVQIKIAIDAFVPDSFVATSEERMAVYKQISLISSLEEMEKIKLELNQTYGVVPREVENLLKISLARKIAKQLGAVEIVSMGAEVSVVFDEKSKISESEILAEAIYKFKNFCVIDFSSKPKIKFDKEKLTSENFAELLKFLLFAKKLIKDA